MDLACLYSSKVKWCISKKKRDMSLLKKPNFCHIPNYCVVTAYGVLNMIKENKVYKEEQYEDIAESKTALQI